ncbi:MAG: Ppx/GppA family phosphatase [Pseudomonadota bacterium]
MGAAAIDETPSTGRASLPIGIIDIGSNSVRMVVYEGLRRSPHVLFNEKAMCGLGRDLSNSNRLPEDGVACALDILARFAHLARDMGLAHLEAAATSAVRDAVNGPAFVAAARQRCGLLLRVLTGEEEARYAAYGVISGIPDADGIVGDLGGGSLELVRVAGGEAFERATLPIGPLRLLGDKKLDGRQRAALVRSAVRAIPWLGACAGKPLYLVGGAWRALARAHMQRARYPLKVVHEYRLSPAVIKEAVTWAAALAKKPKRCAIAVPEKRLPALPLAARILNELMAASGASGAIVSALGVREGLLYERLPSAVKAQDPFIEACEEMAARLSRFPDHGELLMAWLDPLFGEGEDAGERRLRRGICLLSDIGWRGHPDFRAEAVLYDSLYGWFVGIDARGRAMLGLALFVCYGASPSHPNAQAAARLLTSADRARAIAIGSALRLAQRLSGGTAPPLANSRLEARGKKLILSLAEGHAPLMGEVVRRRLAALAGVLQLSPEVRVARLP